MDEDRYLKMLLPAGAIPDFSKVTKIRGEKVYTIRPEIKIYGVGGEPQRFDAKDVKFMVDDTGGINAVSNSTELVWHVSVDALIAFLENEIGDRG